MHHKGFKFSEIRQNEIYVFIETKGYGHKNIIKVKRTMYDGLEKWIEDNY